MVEGEWKEINCKTSHWCIPGSMVKNGKDFIVPLYADLLDNLKDTAKQENQTELIYGALTVSAHPEEYTQESKVA